MKSVNEKLIKAAENGSVEELKSLLLLPECDPKSKNAEGWTALIWAASRGHNACVELLIPVSDALAYDGGKLTALMWAAANNGKSACLQLLLPVSDALACDERGMTALMWAAAFGNTACVQLLLPRSPVLAQDNDGQTASGHARIKSHAKLADFIDGYALALGEVRMLQLSSGAAVPCKSTTLRV